MSPPILLKMRYMKSACFLTQNQVFFLWVSNCNTSCRLVPARPARTARLLPPTGQSRRSSGGRAAAGGGGGVGSAPAGRVSRDEHEPARGVAVRYPWKKHLILGKKTCRFHISHFQQNRRCRNFGKFTLCFLFFSKTYFLTS